MKRFCSPRSSVIFLLSLALPLIALAAPASKPTLLALAKARFAPGRLTAAEEKLFSAVEKGEEASMLSENDKENDPALAASWPPDRAIRAEAFTWLCTNPEAAARITYRGIRISGVRIDGYLELSEATINFSIVASRCAFSAILLDGAHLRTLSLPGSSITNLAAEGCEIGGDVILSDGFKGDEIILSSATITGGLNARTARFSSLQAVETKITHEADLRGSDGGSINFLGATIGGSLDCDGANLSNPGATALLADRITVSGNVFLRPDENNHRPFRAKGQVNLLGAIIGGSLECDGAELSDPPPDSTGQGHEALLLADRARLAGNIFLRGRFRCDGIADFSGAEAASLIWADVLLSDSTLLSLRSAKLGALWSDNSSWPKAGNVLLDGLVYNRVYAAKNSDVADFLKLLALQRDDQFHAQPYEQLAAVFKSIGREREARDVMVAKNRKHREFTRPRSPEWWWYNVFGRVIGYGYLPSRAFGLSIALIGLGAVLFRLGYVSHLISPTTESAYARYGGTPDPAGSSRSRFSPEYPKFSALVFSLESFTPLLRLDQSANWAPNAYSGQLLHLGKLRLATTGQLLRLYLWCHIIAGWVLTSLWVGSITGLVKS